MSVKRRVLLVSPTLPLAKAVARSVRHAGHDVTVVTSFQAARAQLSNPPDLLITELKLDGYNGLQLALRVAFTGTPTIVVSEKSFEDEVERLGMCWVSPESAIAGELPAAMTRALQGVGSAHAVYPWYDAGEITHVSPGSPAPVGITTRTGTLPH